MKLLTTILAFLSIAAQSPNEWLMPDAQFVRFKNRRGPKGEGSCVYAANSMVGAHHGIPGAEYFLEPWEGHPPCMDGSYPSRFIQDCQERGLDYWSIEGPETIDWIVWNLQRGGYCGITYGVGHMITVAGYDESTNTFELRDNNYPGESRFVNRDTFVREHRIHGGGWCTIPKTAGPPPWANAGEPRQ